MKSTETIFACFIVLHYTTRKLSTKFYKLINQVMKKHFRNLLLSVVAISAFAACQEKPRNTEELVDPWLRERTPVNVRLQSQVGPAIISSDWRTDHLGTVVVSLVTPDIDLSAVKVVALDFAYPESEFCPTADLKPGDLIDLTDGFEEFTVTAKTGETRTYTITYNDFKDELEGTFSFTPVGGLLDKALSDQYRCGCIMIGGFETDIILCQVMDKFWLWWDYSKNPPEPKDYWPIYEDDNILSFRLDRVDDITGETFGTVVNTPGADGKYADYQLKDLKSDREPSYDINDEYRLIPKGKARWAKHGDGFITIYAYEDAEYKNPMHKLELLDKTQDNYDKETDKYVFWKGALNASGADNSKSITVPALALHRSFGEGPFMNETNNWGEERWYVNNIRNVFWLIQKDTDSALEDHADWLAK